MWTHEIYVTFLIITNKTTKKKKKKQKRNTTTKQTQNTNNLKKNKKLKKRTKEAFIKKPNNTHSSLKILDNKTQIISLNSTIQGKNENKMHTNIAKYKISIESFKKNMSISDDKLMHGNILILGINGVHILFFININPVSMAVLLKWKCSDLMSNQYYASCICHYFKFHALEQIHLCILYVKIKNIWKMSW